MQRSSILPLILGVAALGLSTHAVLDRSGDGDVASDETAMLEARVEALEAEVETLRRMDRGPALTGSAPGAGLSIPSSRAVVAGEAGAAGPAQPSAEELAALVSKAVDKKAEEVEAEYRIKANKKPPIDDFVDVLELDARQRAAIEREVMRGQESIVGVLAVPTEDGTILIDELKEHLARQMAEPGKPSGLGPWFQRVMSEKVPGSNRTYGAEIESVKQEMRKSFQQTMNKKQWAEFQAWAMDPSEIRKVDGAAFGRLEAEIRQRARDLGAEIPEDDK